MFHYLKLVRLPNLLVVVLTQALIFYHLILPAFGRNGIVVQSSNWEFWLIVFACVSVTAAGYIINDILDAEGDAVNRPGTNPVFYLGLANCRFFYLVMVFLGYTVCLLLTFTLEQYAFFWLYPAITGLLALYSRYIKTLPFLGNLLVATLCAGVPGLIALAERKGLAQLWQVEPATVRLLVIYGCFAFLTTLVRELVKDMEDEQGDLVLGRRTLPIVLGKNISSILALLLLVANLVAISSPYILAWPGFQNWPVILLSIALGIGLLFLSILLVMAKSPAHYGRISQGLKLMMLVGLFMLVML